MCFLQNSLVGPEGFCFLPDPAFCDSANARPIKSRQRNIETLEVDAILTCPIHYNTDTIFYSLERRSLARNCSSRKLISLWNHWVCVTNCRSTHHFTCIHIWIRTFLQHKHIMFCNCFSLYFFSQSCLSNSVAFPIFRNKHSKAVFNRSLFLPMIPNGFWVGFSFNGILVWVC